MRVTTDPKTGRMQTEHYTPPVSQAQLDETRRQVKDMIAGNIQFHVDPFTPVASSDTDGSESIHDGEIDWFGE